ncbi:hypothetical protein PMZ80_001417 [Knufia obscura]|nr:hypothetical protein PMZ80_001417 [Knufia obscura]
MTSSSNVSELRALMQRMVTNIASYGGQGTDQEFLTDLVHILTDSEQCLKDLKQESNNLKITTEIEHNYNWYCFHTIDAVHTIIKNAVPALIQLADHIRTSTLADLGATNISSKLKASINIHVQEYEERATFDALRTEQDRSAAYMACHSMAKALHDLSDAMLTACLTSLRMYAKHRGPQAETGWQEV